VSPGLQRALRVLGTAGAFVVLVVLGLGLASLFGQEAPSPPEPEPVAVVRPAPPPEPSPPPPPPERAPPPAPPPPPAPAPLPTPVVPSPGKPGALTLNARLRIRREIVFGITRLKSEVSRCPMDPVQRTTPAPGRSALVLEAVGLGDEVRIVGSSLESEVPVNDRFVSCARAALEGKVFPAPGATSGLRLRVFVPIGPAGNSLAVSSASLAEVDEAR